MRLPSPRHADCGLVSVVGLPPRKRWLLSKAQGGPRIPSCVPCIVAAEFLHLAVLDMVRNRTQPSPVQSSQLKSCGGASRTNARLRAGFAERRRTKHRRQFCLGLIEQDGINQFTVQGKADGV